MTRFFRIASIIKPIVGVAAMLLIEEGLMALDDAVARWLLELVEPRVLRTLEFELDDTVPAERPITVEDVLSFRLGWGSVMAPPDTYPIQRGSAASRCPTSQVRAGATPAVITVN